MKKQLTGILVLTGLVTLSGCFQTTSFRSAAAPSKKDIDQTAPTPPKPVLTVPQTSHTFLRSSGNEAYVFTLTNSSADRVADLSIVKTFSSNAFFVEREDCGALLPPGSSCSLAINYSNSANVVQTGYITVKYADDKGVAQVPLLLTVQGPAMSSAPAPAPAPRTSPSPSPSPSPEPAPAPPVTGPATISSTYSTQKSNVACGVITVRDVCNHGTPSTFDGVNCLVGFAPTWTARVWYGGSNYRNFYFQARSGTADVCGGAGNFDGVNCIFSSATGPNPRADSTRKAYYFDAGARTVNGVWQAECYEGTSFDGYNCYAGTAPRGPATVEGQVCPLPDMCAGGIFSYPPAGGSNPCGSHWFDVASGKCQVARAPYGPAASVWQSVHFYFPPKNRVCVEP